MTPTRERSSPRFSEPGSTPLDVRAIHRILTGLRDRLRLQEDELDRLRETVQPVANGPTQTQAIEVRIEQIRAEIVARLNEQATASKRPFPVPAPALDPQTFDQNAFDQNAFDQKVQQAAEAIQERVESKLLAQTRALETQATEQGKLLQEAFAVMGRTDANLRKLMTQVDRLLEEVSRRSPAQQFEVTHEGREPVRPRVRERSAMFTAVEDLDQFEDPEEPRFRWKFPLMILALLIAILAAIWFWYFRDAGPRMSAQSAGSALSAIDQAREYENEKNYPKAEETYRVMLARDPNNVEVIRHLASVLYREDKLDESVEVLKKLNSGETTNLPPANP